MSPWGWSPERNRGIWRHGAGWTHPVLAAMPYLTVGLLLVMLHGLGGTLTASKGVLFDLPDGNFTEADGASPVALVMPMQHETIVFFDDTRYVLDDRESMRRFGENLSESLERSGKKSLLILADRRIGTGELMEFVTVARRSGVARVLVAGKRTGGGE